MYLKSLRSLKLIKQFLTGKGFSYLPAFAFESCGQSSVSIKNGTYVKPRKDGRKDRSDGKTRKKM
jgi:hypothetical protein